MSQAVKLPMDGEQEYMDDFAAECYALYMTESTDSLSRDRTLIWPTYEQRYCPSKVITDADSMEYLRRLQTHCYTETMATPMSRLLQQVSNLLPIDANEDTLENIGRFKERAEAWIKRHFRNKRLSFGCDKTADIPN